jgi:hypothetical protein
MAYDFPFEIGGIHHVKHCYAYDYCYLDYYEYDIQYPIGASCEQDCLKDIQINTSLIHKGDSVPLMGTP